MNRKRFVKDEKARIPFSVIGVFLILGSSFTSVYVTNLETQKAVEIASTIDFNEIDNLIRYVEADISTAMNIAGIKGLKKIGEEPVFTCAGGDPDTVNMNRVKKTIMDELNIYLTSHYYYDEYKNGDYVINIIIPEGKTYPINSEDEITFTEREMELSRYTIDLIGPSPTKENPVYWVAEVPISIEIKTVNETGKGQVILEKEIKISSILTARYLLLKALVDEYHSEINGINSLWTFTTIIANLYSLIRGYKHNKNSKPLNIVDNVHLAPVVNSGLLLQQGFVFGSVDPLSLVDLVIETSKALKNKNDPVTNDMKQQIFAGIGENSFEIDTNSFSKNTANLQSGEPENAEIDDKLEINISEFAERILFDVTSVDLKFYNSTKIPNWITDSVIFTGKTADQIQDEISSKVTAQANNGYALQQTIKHLKENASTRDKIKEVTAQVYTADMFSKITKRNKDYDYGKPGPTYIYDDGATPWVATLIEDKGKTSLKPTKGNVKYGSNLYLEKYKITYTREHTYHRLVTVPGPTGPITVPEFKAVIDFRYDDVELTTILDHYTVYGTQDDIFDVLYKNLKYDDLNLEDTVNTYINIDFADSNLQKKTLLKQGIIGTNGPTLSVQGKWNNWVEEDAWDAINEIFKEIQKIKQKESLNSTNYPNTFQLFELIKDDISQKYKANMSSYRNLPEYAKSFNFFSVGKKAVFSVRDWYTDKVLSDFENTIGGMEDRISGQIDSAINDHASGKVTTSNVKDAIKGGAMDALKSQFAIPFGYEITLNEVSGEWDETIRLAVDQKPNYLDPNKKVKKDPDSESFYPLKLRNCCNLGPTGFPILPPTPVTPWIVTLNVWVIDVAGEYEEFRVVDTGDETSFNPIFGHDPQVYIREKKQIKEDGVTLGDNTRLSFEFSTVSFGVAPSWGMMVGDIDADCFDEHTPGFS